MGSWSHVSYGFLSPFLLDSITAVFTGDGLLTTVFFVARIEIKNEQFNSEFAFCYLAFNFGTIVQCFLISSSIFHFEYLNFQTFVSEIGSIFRHLCLKSEAFSDIHVSVYVCEILSIFFLIS